MQSDTQPAFIIRDLDKDPHGPMVPAKLADPQQQQLATPDITPGNSPQMSSKIMTRSASDLSAYSLHSDSSSLHSRSASSNSQGSKTHPAFPFTNIFKWKRSGSNSTVSVFSPGLQSPPEDGDSPSPDYFNRLDQKGNRITNLDNLGHAIEAQRVDFQASLEAQLQEERRLRHLAEDRLTEVEEEVTRLCTVILPTDSGETGEAYFSTVLDSVRMAISTYEERTDGLERQLEEKSARLAVERRERTAADIDCVALRNQLAPLQAQLAHVNADTSVQDRNAELLKQNQELRDQIEQLKLERVDASHNERSVSPGSDVSEDSSETVPATDMQSDSADTSSGEIEASATLLQRIKDTEAQRDALRQVSRGLRQRLTIETRKNADRMRALAAIDRTFAMRPQGRSHSRQASVTSAVPAETKTVSPKRLLGKITEGFGVGLGHPPSRPKYERFVTALEAPTNQMVTV